MKQPVIPMIWNIRGNQNYIGRYMRQGPGNMLTDKRKLLVGECDAVI